MRTGVPRANLVACGTLVDRRRQALFRDDRCAQRLTVERESSDAKAVRHDGVGVGVIAVAVVLSYPEIEVAEHRPSIAGAP